MTDPTTQAYAELQQAFEHYNYIFSHMNFTLPDHNAAREAHLWLLFDQALCTFR